MRATNAKSWKPSACSRTMPILAVFCCLTILPACSARPESPAWTAAFLPPAALLDDIALPPRDGARTVGDLVRIVIADEAAINLKNADLKALRDYRVGLLRQHTEAEGKGK